MDYKKVKTDYESVTHRVEDYTSESGNIYETVVALSKRADQIATELKEELDSKIEEFTSQTDNLEEVFENREQIEIARFYERLPKPHILADYEFMNNKLYIRNPHKSKETLPESENGEA